MSKPAERGLILMPDISGYTAFVHATHADHARRITARLLKALIDTNRLGLQLSDADGPGAGSATHRPALAAHAVTGRARADRKRCQAPYGLVRRRGVHSKAGMNL